MTRRPEVYHPILDHSSWERTREMIPGEALNVLVRMSQQLDYIAGLLERLIGIREAMDDLRLQELVKPEETREVRAEAVAALADARPGLYAERRES